MRLWLDGRPGFSEPPTELAAKAWEVLGQHRALSRADLPLTSGDNLAVRIRFVFPFEGEAPSAQERAYLQSARISALAWFYCHVFEGLLWAGAENIASLHIGREFGRVPGVEVIV